MNDYSSLNTVPLPVKLRVEDYLALDGAGAFDRYAKTELLAGELFYMNAQHRPHSWLKMELYNVLREALRAIDSDLSPLAEASVAIPDHSVPEPDIVVTREPRGDGLVPLESVALIVEVADTTLANDLGRKALLYAEAGIPEYWVADVQGRAIHQMWAPIAAGYQKRARIDFGQPIRSTAIGGMTIPTDHL